MKTIEMMYHEAFSSESFETSIHFEFYALAGKIFQQIS